MWYSIRYIFYVWWQERKDDQGQSGLRPIPAFEEHSILPNGLHEDAKPNFVSVPLVDVDKSYEKQDVSPINPMKVISNQ